MTRKKFIKALMGAGASRNDAADCAALTRDARREYSQVLPDLLNHHRQDLCNSLAWDNMRATIIHGYGTPPTRFYGKIDEASRWRDDKVYAKLVAGLAAKPQMVFVTTGLLDEQRRKLEPLAQALHDAMEKLHPAAVAAGMKISAALAAMPIYNPVNFELEPAKEWTKQNPYLLGMSAGTVLVDEMAFAPLFVTPVASIDCTDLAEDRDMVAHHPEPYTPQNLDHGLCHDVRIMSKADHAALHTQGGGGHD